eukprot:2644980-Pleurochrysis_carterae.AAC.1
MGDPRRVPTGDMRGLRPLHATRRDSGGSIGSPPPATRACATDGSSATTRIRTWRQPRVGERGWARWP